MIPFHKHIFANKKKAFFLFFFLSFLLSFLLSFFSVFLSFFLLLFFLCFYLPIFLSSFFFLSFLFEFSSVFLVSQHGSSKRVSGGIETGILSCRVFVTCLMFMAKYWNSQTKTERTTAALALAASRTTTTATIKKYGGRTG